jgi:hypothetical protein
MSNTYQVALAAHDEACKLITEARRAYRALEIGDSEFIAARKAFDAATALFDAAWNAESEREEVEARVVARESIVRPVITPEMLAQ